MKILSIARKLVKLGERQGDTALKAADILCELLTTAQVPYERVPLRVTVPEGTSVLMVDGREVPSAPTAFVSGTVTGRDSINSSLIPSRFLQTVANINFNPRARSLSRPNFYFAPSLAVRSQEVPTLLRATRIQGTVRVTKRTYTLPQILVGNRVNPKVIAFTHYDSIGPGAIDNASGVATLLATAIENADLRETCLFVFDPNEELSYDRPVYWGRGYRQFQARNEELLAKADLLLSVDCVGNGKPRIFSDPDVLQLAFPITNPERYAGKILSIGADIEGMLTVYQGDKDTIRLLNETDLQFAKRLVQKTIRAAL